MTTLVGKDTKINISFRNSKSLVGKIRATKNDDKWVLICRGLTGNLSCPSSLDKLADALFQSGWSSLRFDYQNSLSSKECKSLRTIRTMTKDIKHTFVVISKLIGHHPDVVIARGLGAILALEALTQYPDVPLIMWAPIVWLQTALELRGRLHQMRRQRKLEIDGTKIGYEFLKFLKDPTDGEIKKWISRKRHHYIVQGKADKVSPVSLTEEFRKIVEQTGSSIKLFTVPGEHPHPKKDTQLQIRKIISILSTI